MRCRNPAQNGAWLSVATTWTSRRLAFGSKQVCQHFHQSCWIGTRAMSRVGHIKLLLGFHFENGPRLESQMQSESVGGDLFGIPSNSASRRLCVPIDFDEVAQF